MQTMCATRSTSLIRILSTLVLASICFMHVNAYSSGAPTAACSSMIPGHYVAAQPGNDGFAVSVDKISLTNGDTLTVTLTGGTFKGLLIQARASSDGNAAGTWDQLTSVDFQHLSCGNSQGAVTHSNGNDKSSPVSFSWIPPASQAMVSYTIYITVVVQRETFYVKIPSQTITYAPTTATTAEPSTTGTTLPTTATTVSIPTDSSVTKTIISPTEPITTQKVSPTESITTQNVSPTEPITTRNVSPTESITAQNVSPTESITTQNVSPTEPITTQNVSPTESITTRNVSPTESITAQNVSPTESITTQNVSPTEPITTQNVSPTESITTQNVSISASNVTNMPHLNPAETTSGFSVYLVSPKALWLTALLIFIYAK